MTFLVSRGSQPRVRKGTPRAVHPGAEIQLQTGMKEDVINDN
jgi:hypothetical protein